ncbi:MAG: flavin containing amine oxidoreductase-like protein [Gammaproteobacteria bacterium]|nr:flavin containing amine oxidoreductase-like protein [Gammaproteobacteria bacterium]HBW84361.1 flavin containing amine oxidoreductase-like protein [Gammaproteobacteria bacterium]|tara:strand:+ start:1188 stop:2165 length:978 start_codon:yes stop_codon:yes gene_type:complete
MRIAVIGAGLSGLSVAHSLRNFTEVQMFEKSRGVGGRLATRRAAGYEFDHGAQFFTCRSKYLESLLKNKNFVDAVTTWEPKLVTLEPRSGSFKRSWFEPHYVGIPSMTAFPKRLARDLDISFSTSVQDITRCKAGWRLNDESGNPLGVFDWVVSAIPAPQADVIFGTLFAERNSMKMARLSPCFALMIALSDRPKLNFDAAVVRKSPISWLALNCSKPARNSPSALVVHSSNDWAYEHIDDKPLDIENHLLTALHQLVDINLLEVKQTYLQRWRYAKVERDIEKEFLIDEENQLAAVGDWCIGNRAEDAFVSGRALAEYLCRILN